MLATKNTFANITFSYWESYLNNQENFGHAERSLSDKNLLSHINNCLESSHESILRIKSDTNNYKPQYILEIGSSVGVICLQAKNLYPDAKVIGIEPEKEALYVSNNIAIDFKLNDLFFVRINSFIVPFEVTLYRIIEGNPISEPFG